MNKEDVLQGKEVLEDNFSAKQIKYGEFGQIRVLGWFDRANSTKNQGYKIYLIHCSKCAEDLELNGEGYYKISKDSLIKNMLPCNCNKNRKIVTETQYKVLCERKAQERGYKFNGFVEDGKKVNAFTRIKLQCSEHGEWCSGKVNSFINKNIGCPSCGKEMPKTLNAEEDEILKFKATGAYGELVKFRRSSRKNSSGFRSYWWVDCGYCGESVEAGGSELKRGLIPCMCGLMKQKTAYIAAVSNGDEIIGIKFGVTANTKERMVKLNSTTSLKIDLVSAWDFPSKSSCFSAERECKNELLCRHVDKNLMVRGYTETTHWDNINKIVEIFKRNGGIKVEGNEFKLIKDKLHLCSNEQLAELNFFVWQEAYSRSLQETEKELEALVEEALNKKPT